MLMNMCYWNECLRDGSVIQIFVFFRGAFKYHKTSNDSVSHIVRVIDDDQ